MNDDQDGQFDNLPGPTYANGFVRAYANYLGLEVDEVMRRYKLAALNNLAHPSLAPLSLTAEARLPTRLVLLVAALLAAGTYGVWYYLMVSDQSSKEVISALPETMSDVAGLTKKPNKKTMDLVEKISINNHKYDIA